MIFEFLSAYICKNELEKELFNLLIFINSAFEASISSSISSQAISSSVFTIVLLASVME